LHTGQYFGSVSSDHSQGLALAEQLALPGVARDINKFLCEATQKGTMDLPYTQVVSPRTFSDLALVFLVISNVSLCFQIC